MRAALGNSLAIYLRTSLEDYGKAHQLLDQSSSITNQRKVIQDYIASHRDLAALSAVEYIDDGFTGTNTDRPGFQSMMRGIEAGTTACVIVKDLSRFGRDYLSVGNYLERVFPSYGVRLIAVNDRYDSSQLDGTTGGLDVAFRNFIYESYSKDLSVKVRSAMKTRMERGKFVNHAPYGYGKDPLDKHHLLPDPQTAPIVREIFARVLAGQSTTEIARLLNERGVPTPLQYKQHQVRTDCQGRELLWSHTTVLNILHNRKYTGTMITHTRENRYLRDHSQRRTAPEEWIVAEGMHEALVSQSDFEMANAKLRHPKAAQLREREPVHNVFFCAKCGRKLERTFGNDIYFSCCTHKYRETAECKGLKWSRTDLEAALLPAYRAQIDLLGIRLRDTVERNLSVSGEAYVRVMGRLERALNELNQEKLGLLEQYHDGILSADDFFARKAALDQRKRQFTAEREEAEETYRAEQQRSERQDAERDRAQHFLEDTDATREELLRSMYEAIDRVFVVDESHLDIRWKFDDFFEKYQEEVSAQKKTAG